MNDIAGRIMKIVAEQMGVYSDQVAPDVHFIDDLGADSQPGRGRHGDRG